MPYVIVSYDEEYRCTFASPELDPDTVTIASRHALPHGNGWERFCGVRAVRAFPLPNDRVGVSYVRITDEADRDKRRGIMKGTCLILTPAEFQNVLLSSDFRFDDVCPDGAPCSPGCSHAGVDLSREAASRHPARAVPSFLQRLLRVCGGLRHLSWWESICRRKLIFRVRFSGPPEWRVMERLVHAYVSVLPRFLRKRLRFTTFTLSTDEAEHILGIPEGE